MIGKATFLVSENGAHFARFETSVIGEAVGVGPLEESQPPAESHEWSRDIVYISKPTSNHRTGMNVTAYFVSGLSAGQCDVFVADCAVTIAFAEACLRACHNTWRQYR